MEKFIKPELKIVFFKNNDIIATSGCGCVSDCVLICDPKCTDVCKEQ